MDDEVRAAAKGERREKRRANSRKMVVRNRGFGQAVSNAIIKRVRK